MSARTGIKWLYTITGSGAILGFLAYFERDRKVAQASWTTNFVPSVKWDSNWDRRGRESSKPKLARSKDEKVSEEVKENLPTANRHLFLIRHGEYNMKGDDDSKRKLTALGKFQADCTGKRLKELNFDYSSIIQSTMTRAIETTESIEKHLAGISVVSTELLREGAPIPPEPPIGKFRAEMEFFAEGARIEAAFRKYFHRADVEQKCSSYEIFVCHANVIRYFICRAMQFPPEAWLRFQLHHGSITWLCITPNGNVYAYLIGDCGHIPSDKLSD